MAMDRFWRTVTESVFPWEEDALDFVRQRLPDNERYRVWANFEIVNTDGRIYEVDFLAVTPAGVFLVEVKSWPGRIAGDAGTWTWTHDGRTRTRDNPRILANHKAKVLKSLLTSQRALRKGGTFFVEALVFLSHADVRVDLDERAGVGVYCRDRDAEEGRPGRRGVVHALTRYDGRPRVDRPLAAAIARAMDELGVRPSRRAGRFGDHQLRELLLETDEYQEWRVEKESFEGFERRARLYPVALAGDPEERERRVRAARREFSFLNDLRHPGILWPVEYWEDERGPVLFFDHRGDALRLDHYLRQEHERLTVDQRLALLRQLFEAVDFAHHRGLVHRALSPRAVEVESAGSAAPRVKVGEWHQGRRSSGSRLTATDHVGAQLDEPSRLYLAPETWTRESIAEYDERKLDVFSLGALAYHVFTGAPPAADLLELDRKLREGPGLRLSSVVDGAVTELQVMIADATHPDVVERLDSVADLLAYLDLVEEALTEPDASAFADPRTAKAGDVLPGGYKVEKVLGSGAAARVFRVPRGGGTAVLKVALEPKHDARLRDEHEILEKLRHQFVVAPLARVDVGGRTGILMEEAGDETLERKLLKDGALAAEDLQRLGDELLQVVDHLEEKGISHRDLKPANLGLRGEPGGRKHLAVFDFSLSRTPAESVFAGTVGYLDPFLRREGRGRWDVHAERFAAAVTLYEMATGVRPVLGDGRSDPALVEDAEPRVEPEQFPDLPPERAGALAAFFRRALAPDLEERFDTCEEMIEAWRQVFGKRALPAPAADVEHETGPDARVSETRRPPHPSWLQARIDAGLDALELSTRARGALDRAGAATVGDVIRFTLPELAAQRNVGQKTRRELAHLLDVLRERFPEAAPPPPEPAEEAVDDPGTASVDVLFDALVPQPRRADSREADVVRLLLGLAEGEADSVGQIPPTPLFQRGAMDSSLRLGGSGPLPVPPFEKGGPGGIPERSSGPVPPPLGPWPSQTDVATALGVTRARVGQVTTKARSRWLRQPALTALRTEVATVLEKNGGVMTGHELADAVLFLRGSTRHGEERRRRSAAVVRAAVEAEAARDTPRFAVYRRLLETFVATAGDDGDTGPRLATWASHLGQRADQLADADPLPGAARVLESLRAVTPPEGVEPPSADRLLRLAAAASHHAAVSARQELYPRGLAAERAVSLASGALLGAQNLDVDGVHRRVYGRFPEAGPLPRRPELDALLQDAGTGLTWWPGPEAGDEDGRYGPPLLPTLSSDTAHGAEDLGPAMETARFERLLERSARDRAFLVLTVTPRLAERTAEVLAERFDVTRLCLERLLIEAMQRVAQKEGADWDVVLAADAMPRSSDDWRLLLDLVRRLALPEVEAGLGSAKGTMLLTRPGLLARYDALAFLDRLRERTGRELGAWVLVPTGDPRARPSLEGRVLPVVGPGDWVPVPESWVEGFV